MIFGLAGLLHAQASPAERLDALAPGLGSAVAARTDAVEPVAALLERADPDLVRLLLPARPDGPVEDAQGEVAEVDLREAEVHLDGTVLTGAVAGRGVRENGAWLRLDTKDGPAPDLELGFGAAWLRASRMADGKAQGNILLTGDSVVDGDVVRFRVDLAQLGDVDAAHAGSVVALVRGATQTDYGPAGALGPVEPYAVDALLALMGPDAATDPDLTVAVALAFGPWRRLVAPDVVPLVEQDAAAWLKYGLGVDAWLAAHGAGWSLRAQSPAAKLLWAWPGGQSFAYGAFPVATQSTLLSRERYRFAVPDVATLVALRDMLPIWPTVADTAARRDGVIWAKLRYRASPDGMRVLCASGEVRANECKAWLEERAAHFDLGEIDGVHVAPELGASAWLQVGLHARFSQFWGDCSTAVAIATAAYQAVGIVPFGLGYAGTTFDRPTHDFPLYLDGDRFWSPQAMPGPQWTATDTYAYAVVPVLDPVLGTALGTERTGWVEGGAVAGGHVTYGIVARAVSNGLPLSLVADWVLTARAGRWVSLD